jgi:hypothetical protein
MKHTPTFLSEKLPPVDTLLAVICRNFQLKAATFDGCYFYDKESDSQLALGFVQSWLDMSCYDARDLPMAFGNLHASLNALKAFAERVK